MRFFKLSAAAALCAGTLFLPAFAAGDRSDQLLELIRANGCQMSADEADEILPKHEFTMAETRDIVRAWAQDGLIDTRDFGGIKLSDKGCNG